MRQFNPGPQVITAPHGDVSVLASALPSLTDGGKPVVPSLCIVGTLSAPNRVYLFVDPVRIRHEDSQRFLHPKLNLSLHPRQSEHRMKTPGPATTCHLGPG